MDPVSAGVLSTLVANGITALVGSARKKSQERKSWIQKKFEKDSQGDIKSLLVPLLAELKTEDLAPTDIELFKDFLHSHEAHMAARMIAVATQTGNWETSESEIREQLSALLILVASVGEESAKSLSDLYYRVTRDVVDRASKYLRQKDVSGYGEIRRQAELEYHAGCLKTLALRTRTIQKHNAAQLAKVLGFLHDYVRLVNSRTAEIFPADLAEHRGVSLESMYVAPYFEPVTKESKEQGITVENLLGQTYRSVVLGDPGAGKSTLAQKIVHDLSDGKVGGAARAPFLVTLRDYEQYRSSHRESIARYISVRINSDLQLEVPDGAIEYLLATGRAFVVFDGLDELLDTHKKREMARSVESFAELYAPTPVLVTSRSVGYPEAPLAKRLFKEYVLAPFTKDQVVEYVRKWFHINPTLTPNERTILASQFIAESNNIEDLRQNPLLLSLLCSVYRGARSIPQNRADLYEQCAVMLFERWDASRGIKTQGPLRSDARFALQTIALWLYLNPEFSSGIPHHRLKQQLKSFLMNTRYEAADRAEAAAEQLLSLWRGRAWVLTDFGTSRSGEPLYKFTHQTFLEYFAAIELVRQNSSSVKLWEVLAPHIAAAEWDIVAQIAIQTANRSWLNASDEILELLLRDVDSRKRPEQARMLNFAARNIDALLPTPRVIRLLTRACTRLFLGLLPAVRKLPARIDHYYWRTQVGGSERDDLLLPLLLMLSATDELGDSACDEYVNYLNELMHGKDSELRGQAFILASSSVDLVSVTEALIGSLGDRRSRLTGMPESISPTLIRSIVNEVDTDNLWVPLQAFRAGIIDVFELVRRIEDIAVLYCAGPCFQHTEISEDVYEPAVVSVVNELVSGDPHNAIDSRLADMLRSIARGFRNRFVLEVPDGIDRSWLVETNLGDVLVKRMSPVESRMDDNFVDLDDVLASNAPHIVANSEAWLGLIALLAVVVEYEAWDIFDYSANRMARIVVPSVPDAVGGILIFRLAKLPYNLRYEVDDALQELGIDGQDARLLRRWAVGQLRLVEGTKVED